MRFDCVTMIDGTSMSKAEILRGVVTEKLTSAAQEIFAVLERTVAGYEEEASGFRQEIARQRRQLELLLQPHVKLERRDGWETLQEQEEAEKMEVAGGKVCEDEEEEEEEDGEQQLSVEDSGRAEILNSVTEEEEVEERPALTSSQEDLEEPDHETASRSFVCKGPSDRRKTGRPQIGRTQDHLDLRIRILEDSQIQVLSTSVFQRCPVVELQCPRGLQGADFLLLLRSTFPQLAGDVSFDFFITDRTRRLQPLMLKTLTPEELRRSTRSAGNSALYIRLQTADELQTSRKCDLSQSKDEATTDSASISDVSLTSQQQQQDPRPEKAEDDGPANSDPAADISTSSPVASVANDDCEEDNGDDDWKPDEVDQELQSRGKRSGVKTKLRKRTRASQKVSTDSGGVLSCKVCSYFYMSKNVALKHALSHVGEPESVCGVCGERFASAEELKTHLQGHQKTHSCSVCGKSFICVTSFREHVAKHSGEKPHQCHVCSKAFFLKSYLKTHQKLHVADKRHKCDLCQKSFHFKAELRNHSRLHTGEKPYGCEKCGKSFADLRSLSRHTMVHLGERRHGCQICGKRFKGPHQLKNHEKIHTVRDKPYLCHVCCQAFYTSGSLKVHMTTHTAYKERSHICGKCGKRFGMRGELMRHVKTHSEERPYSCSQCSQSFKSRRSLTPHLKLHSGAKPFVCGVCGKTCAKKDYLTVHMRTHNGERPYKCSQCDKAFTQSHCLKTHMKSHRDEQQTSG